MKDILPIVEAAKSLEIEKCVLATVMQVEGSSYRGPGAKMLIAPDGKWYGAISGGCLEGDALRKAREVMQTQQPKLEYYDTFEEENNSIGYVLGCNGRIHVLLEPFTSTLYKQLAEMKADECHLIATVFHSDLPNEIGQRMIWKEKTLIADGLLDQDLKKSVMTHGLEVWGKGVSYPRDIAGRSVFFDLIKPTIRLLIFGAGHDVKPVVQLAKSLHWQVEIYDECIAHLAPVHFPQADKLQMCQREFIATEIQTSAQTAILLMSHNLHYDTQAIRALGQGDFFYVGAIGPKKRAARIKEALEEEGVWSVGLEEKFHAPVGLDIGANTPQEIALSIITEIMAVYQNREGGKLKNRKKPIHDRLKDTDLVVGT